MRHPALTDALHAIRLGTLTAIAGYVPALYIGAAIQTLWNALT